MADLSDVRVGDEVLVRATVVRVAHGVELLVELFSNTDQYQTWIRNDAVVEVVLPDPPVESPDGTILLGVGDVDSASVFRRDDANGHADSPTRRYDRRWWDYAAGVWVDWPTAVRRGADPSIRLVAQDASGHTKEAS